MPVGFGANPMCKEQWQSYLEKFTVLPDQMIREEVRIKQ